MKSPSTVAVVIPCHDLGHTLEEAVDSALAQTRLPEEIVVIDDGSNDVSTQQILRRLVRPRTRVVTLPPGGVAAARNHGVALTESSYVVLLDADDVLHERYLESLGARLDDDPTVGFVSCAVQAFEGASYVWTPPSTTIVGTLTRGSAHASSMFRRTLWEAVGGFDTDLAAYEDMDFWLRALRAGFRCAVVDEPLLYYRVRAQSRYRRAIEPDRYLNVMRRILERHAAVLEKHGIDALIEKQSFLQELIAHQHQLQKESDALAQRLAQLDEQIVEAKRALIRTAITRGAFDATPHKPPVHPAWVVSDVKRQIDGFLLDHRPLIRGSVAKVADSLWALDDLDPPRWDDGVSNIPEQKCALTSVGVIETASQDCLIALVLAPSEPIEETLKTLLRPVKPGGALLLIMPALTRCVVAEDTGTAHPAVTWLRSALGRVVPLEIFDVELRGDDLLATACVRTRDTRELASRCFARRTSPRTGPRQTPAVGLVIAYHRVSELTPDSHRLCVSRDNFRQHMRYLQQQCTVMPLEELVAAARHNALPPRAIAVTIDDGYLDALTAAAPILEEEGVPATFFINTEWFALEHESWHDVVEHILLGEAEIPSLLELPFRGATLQFPVETLEAKRAAQMALHQKLLWATASERIELITSLTNWSRLSPSARSERRLMVPEEVQALARVPGCDIGSHSVSHLWLPRHGVAIQRAEVEEAKRELESLLDRAVVSFAYPFGAHDERVQDVVRSAPHLLAVTVEAGLVTQATDTMRVPRHEVPNLDATGFAHLITSAFAQRPGAPVGMSTVVGIGEKQGALSIDEDIWTRNDQQSRADYESQRSQLSALPQFLIIDPTSRCNARCVMCPVSFRAPGDHGEDLAAAVFAHLVPVIPTASQVNLFSSGEPTIARDMVEILRETRRHSGPHTFIRMSTNGKRLPPEILEELIAPRMGLQFSVDGGTKHVFDEIRRGITFEQLCQSLDATQRLKGKLPYPTLSFSSTMSKRNIHDLANIFELAERYGVEHIYFYEEDPEVPEEERFALDTNDRPTFEAQLPRIHRTGVKHSNGLYFRGADGLRAVAPDPPPDPPAITCMAPWKVFHQRADGTVRTCCTLRQSMGDLRHQSFEEVWNGEEYVKLRRAFITQSGIPATCYRCTDPLRTWGRDRQPTGPVARRDGAG